MVLQVFCLTADVSNAANSRKIGALSKHQSDFNMVLKDIEQLTKKTFINKMKENDANVQLMQLLYYLNTKILWQDIKGLLEQQPTNKLANIDSILYSNIKVPVNELKRLLLAMITEFNATGDIRKDTVEKLFSFIMPSLSNDVDSDINFQTDITEMLKNSKISTETNHLYILEKLGNNKLEPNSFMFEEMNLEDDEGIKNDELDAYQLNKKIEFINNYESKHGSKLVSENEKGYCKKFEELDLYQVDTDTLQQSYTLISNTQKNYVIPMDKVTTLDTNSFDSLDIFEQLIDKVKVAIKGEVQEVKVRLKPDYLGDILIKITSDKDKMIAELFVDNSKVRSMLKAYALEFEKQLREHGYSIAEINVYKMVDSLGTGVFDYQSSSDNFREKKFKGNSYRNQSENHQVTVTDNYNIWGDISNFNYIV